MKSSKNKGVLFHMSNSESCISFRYYSMSIWFPIGIMMIDYCCWSYRDSRTYFRSFIKYLLTELYLSKNGLRTIFALFQHLVNFSKIANFSWQSEISVVPHFGHLYKHIKHVEELRFEYLVIFWNFHCQAHGLGSQMLMARDHPSTLAHFAHPNHFKPKIINVNLS